MNALAAAVRDALGTVFDPCSLTVGTPISIVDMGLVTRIDADLDGRVRIAIRTTSPLCTLIGSIAEAAETRARQVPGVTAAEVRMLRQAGWTEREMTDRGRAVLHRQRRQMTVRPREWQQRHTAATEG
jgi:metal-sulfur cluster biosynthetic enzyme